MIQKDIILKGTLSDFSAVSFRINLSDALHQNYQKIDAKSNVRINIENGNIQIYSGKCKLIKQANGSYRNFVVEPIQHQIQRYEPKEYRSTRQELVPLPNIIFKHPITGKIIDLKIVDISGSGFSVEEYENTAVLLPGMIIPELELSFAGSIRIKCRAQVLYRKKLPEVEGESIFKIGFAIIDMDDEGQVLLSALLHQAENKNSYVCNKVDMNALWDFFFETGFIYPKKYKFIEANKEKIKETYEKLYTKNLNIARHFTYINNGIIHGHLSMLRFYENTWMIHHHAARKSTHMSAGLSVMSQIGRFINESFRLDSSHLDFLFCYFRPENAFPNYFFGGVARNLNDARGCSIDEFAYCHFKKGKMDGLNPEGPWSLVKTDDGDLQELKDYYKNQSGGLMIDAFDLGGNNIELNDLKNEYDKIGLSREINTFSLKHNDNLKAIIIINKSDIGLNLSDLTNSFMIVILDPVKLKKDILYSIIVNNLEEFHNDEMPVLIYPNTYANDNAIDIEKIYRLWILNTQYLDQYFRIIDEFKKETIRN
ncbi:PilZ domain-containing protein [Spirochaetota bacterium]